MQAFNELYYVSSPVDLKIDPRKLSLDREVHRIVSRSWDHYSHRKVSNLPLKNTEKGRRHQFCLRYNNWCLIYEPEKELG